MVCTCGRVHACTSVCEWACMWRKKPMSDFSPLCPSSYFFETGSPTVSEVTYPARQGDNDLSTLPISAFPGLGFRPSNYCCQLGQQACYWVIFPSLWAYIELNSWVQNSISYLVWKNEVLFLLLKKCTCFFKEWILAMCFSVRKIESATCWQHLSPNYLCAAFPSDAVRF